jgi:hypothetical protein
MIIEQARRDILGAYYRGDCAESPTREQLLDVVGPFWGSLGGTQRLVLGNQLQEEGFGEETLIESLVAFAHQVVRTAPPPREKRYFARSRAIPDSALLDLARAAALREAPANGTISQAKSRK